MSSKTLQLLNALYEIADNLLFEKTHYHQALIELSDLVTSRLFEEAELLTGPPPDPKDVN